MAVDRYPPNHTLITIEVYGITSKPGKAKAVAQHCDTVPEFIIKLKNELVMVEFLG